MVNLYLYNRFVSYVKYKLFFFDFIDQSQHLSSPEMCYHGNFGWQRPLNLKHGAEMAGGYLFSNPLNRAFMYLRLIDLVVVTGVLIIDFGLFDSDDLTNDEVYAQRLAVMILGLYVAYSLIVCLVSCQVYCREVYQSVLISGLYYIAWLLLQGCIGTIITLLCLHFSRLSAIALIGFVVILVEFFMFNLFQFHFIYGLVALMGVNFGYFGLFLATNNNSDEVDKVFNAGYIILLVVIHFVVTHIKRNQNTYFWLRENMERNVIRRMTCDPNSQEKESMIFPEGNDSYKYCTISFGSCTDQTFSRLPSHQAMIQRNDPNVVVLAGDNIYGDLAPPTCTKFKYKCPCCS